MDDTCGCAQAYFPQRRPVWPNTIIDYEYNFRSVIISFKLNKMGINIFIQSHRLVYDATANFDVDS